MILLQTYDRLKIVEDRFRAAKASVDHFFAICQKDSSQIDGIGLRVRDIRDCGNDLEDTYLIRAYAVFETILRDYWHTCKRRSRPNAEYLINHVGSTRTASSDDLKAVHAVREYRNRLVHGGAMPAKITMAEGRSYMCRFLRYLPPAW